MRGKLYITILKILMTTPRSRLGLMLLPRQMKKIGRKTIVSPANIFSSIVEVVCSGLSSLGRIKK